MLGRLALSRLGPPVRTVRRAAAQRVQTRGMGGGGHGGTPDPKYNYFIAPHVSEPHRKLGEYLMVMTWLWIFYRAKEDGMTVFFGVHPWDAHGGHDDHHDHHHEADYVSLVWEKKELGVRPSLVSDEEHDD